jgi:acyl-CoA thioester hydrolase
MTTIAQVHTLPCFNRVTIGPEHLDEMGHMNVRWYVGLFDDTTWGFFASFGMTADYCRQHNAGGFALKQFIRYLAEVHAGQTIAIHTRLLGYSTRRIHFMHFMHNESTDTLAATIEILGSYADLLTRRTAPFPPPIAARLSAILSEHQQLDWDAPVCGVINT